MISGSVVGGRLDGAAERVAAERAEAHDAHLRRLAGLERQALVVDHDQLAVALDDRPRRGEVERHDRDLLEVDVLPDVELGPVRQREDADALALVDPAVVEVPQLGPLVLRIPLVEAIAERVDALLGARLLLVAARAAERGVEPALGRAPASSACVFMTSVYFLLPAVERVERRRSSRPGSCARSGEPVLAAERVAERDHLAELPGRVDVQQRERQRRRDGTPSAPGAPCTDESLPIE